ncbi:hypothetical protein KM043_012473 [Ampulex compressa]|nr:hypothetical protein KM043_012473 [Ampulex compressa]
MYARMLKFCGPTEEARNGKIRAEGDEERPDSDIWSRVPVRCRGGLPGREAEFAGGISGPGSASWIASCRAAFAFPRTLRGIPVRSLLSKGRGGGKRADRDVKSFC